MLMCELNRISSHLLWLATNGADLGALNMLVYGWRDRELVLAFFEKVTGLRMNHNYIRPGGVAADLPDGWRDDVMAICDTVVKRMDEYDDLLTGQPLLQNRMDGVGALDAATAVGLGLTGPLLRSTGVAYDVRRDFPYLFYDEVDFDVIVGTAGDCWDRFAIRANEIRESVRILRQVAKAMPAGDYRVPGQEVHAAAPQPDRRVDGGADPPLQAVHRGVPGGARRCLRPGRVPPGGARLLHRLGRHVAALPPARAGPLLRQPAGPGAHGPGRLHPRRHRLHIQHRPGTGGRRPLSPTAQGPDWAQSRRLGKDR